VEKHFKRSISIVVLYFALIAQLAELITVLVESPDIKIFMLLAVFWIRIRRICMYLDL
jgi:hypothetical protein